MWLLEEQTKSKSETPDKLAKQEDAGGKSYNEKLKSLIYTDATQQILM